MMARKKGRVLAGYLSRDQCELEFEIEGDRVLAMRRAQRCEANEIIEEAMVFACE